MMYSKIRQFYEDHGYTLEDGSVPEASQIWNGDEIGFDPNGKWEPVFYIMPHKRKMRVFQARSGERAPFWGTMFFWSRADGQCFIPPTIVHQGAALAELHILNLPPDWQTHVSPSGYMDRDGFLKVAQLLIDTVSASATNPQVSIISVTLT
jgi:hypothetical protein